MAVTALCSWLRGGARIRATAEKVRLCHAFVPSQAAGFSKFASGWHWEIMHSLSDHFLKLSNGTIMVLHRALGWIRKAFHVRLFSL